MKGSFVKPRPSLKTTNKIKTHRFKGKQTLLAGMLSCYPKMKYNVIMLSEDEI